MARSLRVSGLAVELLEAPSLESWGGVDRAVGAVTGSSLGSATFCEEGFALPLNAEVTAAIPERIAPM